jgi:hypothetical protein
MRAAYPSVAVLGLMACLSSAMAHPKQIIILRHGEKTDTPALCATGKLRAEALAVQYLGKGAADSLFGGEAPAVFYAITAHTVATITPAATTWGMKVKTPPQAAAGLDKEAGEDQQTRYAANDVMTNPEYTNRIVVMTWEHKHIANHKLQKEGDDATLRQLLLLKDAASGDEVPKTWSGTNYDYFWIVNFADPASDKPTGFGAKKQVFAPPYRDKVPHNDWETDEPPELVEGCLVKQ